MNVVRIGVAMAGALLLSSAAQAGLTTAELDSVGVAVPANARVPTALSFIDETGAHRTLAEVIDGHPSVVVLADYTCQTLCGPVLALVASALRQSGLKPGSDYRLIAIGLDVKDGPADARAMKAAQIGDGDEAGRAATFLTTDAASLERITTALGYTSAYDPQTDQFAHPAAVFVVAPDGRVARALSGLALQPSDLRLALIEAGAGTIGSVQDQVRLLCYGFDPATGVYTLAVYRLLAFGSLLALIGLGGGIGFMVLQERRAR